MKPKALLAATAFLLAAAIPASAAITMLISDDGTNLTMTATGSYTLANAVYAGGGSSDTIVAPNLAQYGWAVNLGPQYTASFAGALTGPNMAFATSATATEAFYLTGPGNGIVFSSAAPVFGSVNNTATFDGVTLASLGMVSGESLTVTWGLGGADETLTLTVVPEPSALLLSALAVPTLLRRRR